MNFYCFSHSGILLEPSELTSAVLEQCSSCKLIRTINWIYLLQEDSPGILSYELPCNKGISLDIFPQYPGLSLHLTFPLSGPLQ